MHLRTNSMPLTTNALSSTNVSWFASVRPRDRWRHLV